ncbi:DUF6334 family protein [Actinoplanes sp. NPDC051861]|uniref:DUF6334 family protein n=1 Tax=Actinoplanes sp. NPDC051861 TaxID=3155170 RepID=UPI00341AB3E7
MTLPSLGEVADTFGAVRQILVDDTNPALLSALVLVFEHGTLAVEAVADDDTVEVSLHSSPESVGEDVSGEPPWSLLVGGTPLWLWSMINQHGFRDGLQIMARRGGVDVGFQLMVIAGSLKPFLVIEQ